jgi:hypothetical protein
MDANNDKGGKLTSSKKGSQGSISPAEYRLLSDSFPLSSAISSFVCFRFTDIYQSGPQSGQ